MSLRKIARILRSKRVFVPLMLILIASSAAFTVTFSLLLSIQSVGSNALGESNGVVIVSSGNSRTPLTSVIPIALIGKIGEVSGISYISPEVLAPSTISNRSVIVRGVDPAIFNLINKPEILRGSAIELNDSTQVMVGSVLATQLNITVGNQLLVIGVLHPVTLNVIVTGIFRTGTVIDDEIVAPLWDGQWLRGLGYSAVSIFRVQIEQGQSISQITHELQSVTGANYTNPQNNSSISSILSYLPYSSASTNFSNLNLNISPSTSQEFLSKAFGLNQESILLLSSLVFVSLSVAIIFAYQEAVSGSKSELGTLKALGMSSRRLTKDLVVIALSFAIVAAITGWMLGFILINFIPNMNPLILAFYSVHPDSSVALALVGTTGITVLMTLLAAGYSSSQLNHILDKPAEYSEVFV